MAAAENLAMVNFEQSLGAGGGSSELAAADAQAALADALIKSSLQLPDEAVKTLMFLREYLGPEAGSKFARELMTIKPHSNPGALKRITEAIKAFSLQEFMRGVNLNLGGK